MRIMLKGFCEWIIIHIISQIYCSDMAWCILNKRTKSLYGFNFELYVLYE